MKQVSKNEPTDKLVDEKLGKWRQKSIELEKQREELEQKHRQESWWYRFYSDNKQRLTAAFIGGVIIIFALALVLCCTAFSGVKLSKYVTVEYTGANGYASAAAEVKTDKLYQKLAGKEKDSDKSDKYKKLVASIQAQVEQKDISNKDKITVNVSFDEELAKELKVKFKDKKYTIKANGIDEGTPIELFSGIEVVFTGISPEAGVIINNHFEQDYLKDLTFSVDKANGIAKGDTITITCDDDTAEIARHGYLVNQTQVQVTAQKLSVYAQKASELHQELIADIGETIAETIITETEDTTFRMLYKATQDSKYLRYNNEETVSDIALSEVYFLKRKNTEEADTDNYLYIIYEATVSAGDVSEIVYFGFEYTDGYITAAEQFELDYRDAKKRYTCSLEYDTIYNSLIEEKEELYNIERVEY